MSYKSRRPPIFFLITYKSATEEETEKIGENAPLDKSVHPSLKNS